MEEILQVHPDQRRKPPTPDEYKTLEFAIGCFDSKSTNQV